MPAPEPFLRIRGLRKQFGGLEAVRDLSLDIFPGEVFGFLGPNGAGKTTAIRMICGLLQRDAGEVEVEGHTLTEGLRSLRSRIGLCPQDLVIWDSLTCLEQLTFVGTQYDIPRATARARAIHLLEVLGLQDRGHTKARTLSGGMKRRLNLALALVHDPQLLILDEPQAGLDPQSRILVREYIRSLARSKTVLLTTHEMDEADRMADRVGIMDRGRILVVNSPEALKTDYARGEILEISFSREAASKLAAFSPTLPDSVSRLESPPGCLRLGGPDVHLLVPRLMAEMAEAGIAPDDLRVRAPSLEDVFISLTGRRLRE